jgi:tetratricopeptide (TPR) repeat protein
MMLRLSSPARRGALLALAFLATLFLSYFSIRNALAVHYADLQTWEGYEHATRLEPGDFRNWYLLGRYWQYSLEDADSARAIRAYNTALALNPGSADVWSDVATTYESDGNLPAARDAFLHAKRAYPQSAEVSWRYGNFLLRRGELDAAFLELRHAVEGDPFRGAEALSRSLRAEPDIDLVLDRVLPPVSTAYLNALEDQTLEGHTENALKIWRRFASLHPKLQLGNSFSLVSALLREKQIAEAQRVWDQAVVFAGLADLPEPPGSLLWDGGFESGVIGGGFAWGLPSPTPGVQIQIDTREKHSGSRSLQLIFDGKFNSYLVSPCHEVPVQPATFYRFSAWVRTQSLSTDQGIRFQLRPMGTQDSSTVVTPEVHGSQPWTRIELPWSSGRDVREMQVCLVRYPSREADNKIQGIAWVDDVALVLEAAEPSKP